MKYLIIGLGHYGATLAMELTAMGHEVVGADGNGLHVDSVKDRMAASFVLDATDEMALSVLPLKSVDAVIVAIGDNFGASVRIVSLLKKLKVKRIYARAVDEVHKGVLEAFSIDRILTPEQDAARLLAQQLELDGGAEFFQIDGNTYVFKLEIPEKLVGYHINELNLEQEFGLKLISLVQGKQVKNFLGISVFEKEVANAFPEDYALQKGDGTGVLRSLFQFYAILEISPLVHSLTDVSLVQCLLIAAGIGLMLSKGSGEIVRAREIFFGAHVEVIMLCMIQYAFYSLNGSNADRAGGKSGVLVSIVRTFYLQVFVQNASQPEFLQTEFDGRIGLEWHSRL